MYVLYQKEINTSFSTFVRTSRLVLYALQDLYCTHFKTCTVRTSRLVRTFLQPQYASSFLPFHGRLQDLYCRVHMSNQK